MLAKKGDLVPTKMAILQRDPQKCESQRDPQSVDLIAENVASNLHERSFLYLLPRSVPLVIGLSFCATFRNMFGGHWSSVG